MRATWRHALVAALTAVAVQTSAVTAQTSDSDPNGTTGSGDAVTNSPPRGIQFNFKGVPYREVVEFFSRASGLPIVAETAYPEGTLDYFSPETYDLPEALRVLNIILQSKQVMLRVSDDMLYLQKLEKMQQEDVPTYVGEVPAEVTGEQIVTVVFPLNVALAGPLAENLKALVAEYGSITPMPQQNSLVITETAAQVRRLITIIGQLDLEDPEGVIRIYSVRHTKAKDLMVPLKALLAIKVERYVVDAKGKQVKIQEESLPGLQITVDERTNSLVAKGTKARIEQLERTLAMLDTPASAAGVSRTVRTFVLSQITPQDAVAKLNQLFQSAPAEEKPIIFPLNELARVTVVGNDASLNEAEMLLREVDGGSGVPDAGSQPMITSISLEHADVRSITTAAGSLLNPRQKLTTKLVPAPDGKSLILSGLAADVDYVRSLIDVLDKPRKQDRQARLVRLTSNDAPGLLTRTQTLYDRQIDPEDADYALELDFDPEARLLTMIGTPKALDAFAGAMRSIESNTVINRETRQITLATATPSKLVAPLNALANQLLQPHDDSPYTAPTIDAVDPLDMLIITALPEQFGVIDSLITTLDKPDPGDMQFRVIPVTSSNVTGLLEKAQFVFARLAIGLEPDEVEKPGVQHDALTGNLLLTGRTQSVQMYERALAEARRLLPPDRTGKLIELQFARAADVIAPLNELLEKTAPVDAARQVPPPAIEVIERTNSLYVVAETPQHAMVERLVRDLDQVQQTEMPPLRLLQVRAADAAQIAAMLKRRYDSRTPEQRREEPVNIDSDAGTNTLIVTAHETVFAEVKQFVDSVNESGEATSERETMIFALQRARATDLAVALDKLYPEPPIPQDARGRPMPHLRQPKEVYVSADAATNTLIIEAPSERRQSFEALVQQLDRVELPPMAQLRTYHIERGDPERIVQTLTELAKQGVMSLHPEDGTKPVEVLIQAESASRTLIVAGDEVTFAKTEEILKDLQAVPIERTLRLFEVTGADAEELAARAQRLYEEQSADMPDAQPVAVEVDRENATLLVVAENEAMMRFTAILSQLQQSIGPPPDVRLVALEHANATDLVAFLAGLAESELAMVAVPGGSAPVFQAIERTNSVLVAAQPDQQNVIRSLIESFDVPESQAMPPLRILQLRTADAGNLAMALTRQYDQRAAEERRDKPVAITADLNTNALIVAAHPDMLPEVQAIVEELNRTDRADYEGREIRIFPLSVARAEDLAVTIDEMYPEPPIPMDARGRPMPHLRQPREVVVRADPQTNSLIVDAPVQRMAGFDKLVEQLDRQKILEETEVRTYPVRHADLNSLSQTLNQLSQTGALSPAGHDRRTPISISVEPVSRTLVVSGPSEIFTRVERVLTELDVKRTGPATTLRFFRLEHARADTLAPMLREILLSRINEDVEDAGADVTSLLNVTTDRKTNTLIISAPEAVMPVAEQLIEQLDTGTAALSDPVIRVRSLNFADAQEVSTSLSEALPSMISKTTGEPIDVRLIASVGSNAIILVGLQPDLEEVELLIEPLDARPAMDAIGAETVKLTNAEATTIAPIVQGILRDQQSTDPRVLLEQLRRSRRGDFEITPQIRVEADARTNSLIISGPQRIVSLAKALIAQLDEADDLGDRIFATFTPRSADPARLRETVQRVIESTRPAGRRSTLEIVAEAQSGAILIIGSEEDTNRAMALMREWDAKALTAPAMDLKIVSLKNSDASVIASTVSTLLNDQTRWPDELRAAVRAGVAIAPPNVTADASANRLLISAPAVLLSVATDLIAQLDQPRSNQESMDVRIFGLTQAKAEDVAAAIQTAMTAQAAANPGAPAPIIAAEPSSNSVIVTATPKQLAAIATIIEPLDAGIAVDQPQVRSVFLKHARADIVAPIVQALLGAEDEVDVNELPSWDRMRYLQIKAMTGGEAPVRVAADSRLNAVVVAAPPAVLNIAEQMILQLDVDPTGMAFATARSLHVLVVENADAAELATNLEAMFAEADAVDPAPTVRVDTASNSLLIRSTDDQFATIEKIVGEIDRATITASRQMRLIPLDPSRGSAADIAETLRRMLDRGNGSRVEVITVDQLLRRRKNARDPQPEPRAEPTPQPSLIPGAARPFVQDDAENAQDSDITIAVDEATNSLIVIGSQRAIERISALADQLQEQLPAAPGTIRYIPLPDRTDATQMARLVIETLRQMTPPGGERGGYRRRVAVIADEAGNALVIACNDADFVTVGDLILALSQPPSANEMVVKVYPLTSITAERAAQSVRDLIAPESNNRQRGRQAQRMREVAIKLLADDRTIAAVFDPNTIRIAADSQSNALIVMGSAEAIGFIDEFIELIDQAPVNVPSTMKLYPLKHADADGLSRTLRGIFRARFRNLPQEQRRQTFEPEFSSDDRTNTLLVTASPEQLAEVDQLLQELDRSLGDQLHPLKIIELTAAIPSAAADVLKQVVIGTDQDRRASTLIVANDGSGVLLVRASTEVYNEIQNVLGEIDREATRGFDVRTITLERADAQSVAQAIQRFYDDRARIASQGRGRREQSRRISIMGDPNSNALLVAASDDDFDEIQQIVTQFDSPQAAGQLQYRVFELQHAKAQDIQRTVQSLVNELMYSNSSMFYWPPRGGSSREDREKFAVQADERLNVLIVTGEGDRFDVIEQLIDVLDAPIPTGERKVVKVYTVKHADANTLGDVIEEAFTEGRPREWWQPPDPNALRVRVDRRSKTLIIFGTEAQHAEISTLIASVDSTVAPAEQQIVVLPVEFAEANDTARTLTRFFEDRAEAMNLADPTATIASSDEAGALIVSASPDDLATIRDLLREIDQPNVSRDRVVEIISLGPGDAVEIADLVKEQFARRGGPGVIITPDARTNSIIVNAPGAQYAQVAALIAQLDSPDFADEKIIRTYTLDGANAADVVQLLTSTLQLDARGETKGTTIRLEDSDLPAVEVKARIEADLRSNSLVVAATEESFPIIEALIAQVDEVPSANPQDWRILPLKHALVFDVAMTLRQFFRAQGDAQSPVGIDYIERDNVLLVAATTDQFAQIDELLQELDVPPANQREQEFVTLQFAEAEKVADALSYFYGRFAPGAETPGALNVRIVPVPATNSLLITAPDNEWTNIRALLASFDSEEFDTSLQLRVIPLKYADARSVAQAINSAFQGAIDRNQRNGRNNQPQRPRGDGDDGGDRRSAEPPPVLIQSEEWVRASAEPLTNSIIVSASRQNLAKIEAIVLQLDVADFATLPPPQLIRVTSGNPEQIADSLRELYQPDDESRGRAGLRIVGDAASNAIIVRAEDDEFQQIRALAEALQQEAASQGLTVHVLAVKDVPAARVADAIRAGFEAKAKQANLPLSIEVDVAGNSLVIASTAPMFAEIEKTVRQLDSMAPAAGQGIFIIELENIAPEKAKSIIESIGLHEKQPDDSISKLVTEPIKITVMEGRNALLIVANPADKDTIVQLLKAVDAAPELGEARMRVVMLRRATAEALGQILTEVLSPGDQQANTPLAKAIQEQIRRLSIRRDGLDEPDLKLDLTQPIRIIPEPGMNALLISSTPENVAALEELIGLFDRLPVTEAVTVQIFPLENITADRFASIVSELFQQGKSLATLPITGIPAEPVDTVGRALLENIAIAVDDRTNSVVVAGKEEAVALVEVLVMRLDSDIITGWVEPRIVQLTHADATDLAETLEAILVEGAGNLPQSSPLQSQVARLRMARTRENGGNVIESDVFQPMSRLLVRPEPQLNAIVLVGTPANLEIVGELVRMLDVEAASPSAVVRIYPVENASAARLATTITRLFDQQVESKAIRPEDRVIVQPDDRTNSLVVTTSPRSFTVLEHLLDMLDQDIAPDLREIRRIELTNASATRLQDLIQNLMDARLERMRQVQPETAELDRATIIADPRTNSLVVAAGNESYEVIKLLAQDLDSSDLPDTSLVQVVTLTSGNVERTADAVNQIMERRYADLPDELRRSQKPLVLTDPRTNSLLVAANPEDFKAITDLVERLEAAPMNPALGLHILAVEGEQRAEKLSATLQRLMNERAQSLGPARTPTDGVTIEPDIAANSLIIVASEENYQVIQQFIRTLAEAERDPGLGEVEIITLVNNRASDVVDMLDELYVAEENRTRGENTVRVTADDQLNAVLVNAPDRDVAVIRDLVDQLDSAVPARVVEIKYIPLASANALETVSLIDNVLAGRGLGPRRRAGVNTVIRYIRELTGDDAPGEADPQEMRISVALQESITLTPDLRTNTVIVRAPREMMAVIERMIRDLDESSTGAKNVRIFKLVNADASATKDILEELFNLRQGNTLNVLKPREPSAVDETIPEFQGLAGTELTAVPDERQRLSITVDSRTNSLLVSGTPTYLDLVSKVVEELDSQEANQREIFVYPLRNAVASEIAQVIGTFVQEEQRTLISTLSDDQLGSASRILEQQVTIQGDENSNTILVSASPRYMARVKEMIRQLDIDPPQVLIQVLIAEVTVDTRDEWGVEFEGRATADNTSFTGSFDLIGLFAGTMGVPSLSIAASDFDLILRALKAQGRIQVLSNPSVMAANNQEAFIQIGETIQRASGLSVSDTGQANSTVSDEEIGVILTVTPSINPDGFVRMDITPEISLLSERTTQISEDFESPIIIKRTADTTITVMDGQTIIIGGLISDRFERREQKVPVLGDLWLVGPLFRSQRESSVKTELLFVLTPHVIYSPADLDSVNEMTERELDRVDLPDVIKDSIRRSREGGKSNLYDAEGNPIEFRRRDPLEESDDDDPAYETIENEDNGAPDSVPNAA